MATPHFPQATLSKMKEKGITESDVLDTFRSGERFTLSDGTYKMVRRYASFGYIISLLYSYDNRTGEPVILYADKRKIT